MNQQYYIQQSMQNTNLVVDHSVGATFFFVLFFVVVVVVDLVAF